ncbi:MAG: hypothetical protein R3313_04860, partial [Candidatus Saccharimonadales bacterium]|nr:hypothetical protein [Candidatus Saccharimonadales bacterium]
LKDRAAVLAFVDGLLKLISATQQSTASQGQKKSTQGWNLLAEETSAVYDSISLNGNILLNLTRLALSLPAKQ